MLQRFGRNNASLFRLLQAISWVSGNSAFPERIFTSETQHMYIIEVLLGFGYGYKQLPIAFVPHSANTTVLNYSQSAFC